jgi:hypothetical protein
MIMGYYAGDTPKRNYDIDDAMVYCNALENGYSFEEAAKKQDLYIAKKEKEESVIRQNLEKIHLEKLKADIEPSLIHKLFHSPRQSLLKWISK